MFKITNGNDFDFEAGFNGRIYKFPMGKTVACPDDAAEHIFGIGDQNKTAYLARHGWVKVMGFVQDGLNILNKFKFQAVEPDLGVPMAEKGYGPAPVLQEAGEEGVGTDGRTPESPASRGRGRLPAHSALAA
jgi:hypothetical protein